MTDFEKAVYAAVLEIPLGQTRSYAWVARRIGRPRAARAVGNALNKNPYAPFVPCHRVIAADGSLGGFSAGPAKKKALLERERRHNY
ncbi:MAG: methylated-DNA--[protein]-cysteine S-methyltransferase [Deltaproteobacteria bacterium]